MLIHTVKPYIEEASTNPIERILDTTNGLVFERFADGEVTVKRLGTAMYQGDAAIALWALLLEQANTAERHLDSYISQGLVVSPYVERHSRPTLQQLIIQADNL